MTPVEITQAKTRARVLLEDALKYLHEEAYRNQPASAAGLAGALGVSLDEAGHIVDLLEQSELAQRVGEAIALTEAGQEYAGHVVRAHRLYETYLARVSGLPAPLWHERADRKEHRLTPEEVEQLAARLGHPRFDPHGDPIPTEQGEMPSPRGYALLEVEPGWQGRIVHVEDEPREIYEKLAALDLAPGVLIEVTASDADGYALQVNGVAVRLTRAMAANLRVEPLRPSEHLDERVERLSALGEGEEARVVGLAPACVGPERNRLLDLGVVPGTTICIDFRSAHGSPIAYRIRGATIALRREQADRILIRRDAEVHP